MTNTSDVAKLETLKAGQLIVFGGNQTTQVSTELAAAFVDGDRLIVVNSTGDLLHVPEAEWATASDAVGLANQAFLAMGAVPDAAITDFFERFANNLANDELFEPIKQANDEDIAKAQGRGRSTTRLELTPGMRESMIEGLRLWRDMRPERDRVIETINHDHWTLEQRTAGLGVVGFVFEGRPNVFADACGVLRGGNSVVFRIGSDALGTARAIVTHALNPAIASAGMPRGVATLIDSSAHAAGWAMFSDERLALAVARGSGAAVDQLGAVARQAGTSVSLHGTGGAWIVTGQGCEPERLQAVIAASLDRKVCNTVNTICVLRSSAATTVPRVLAGLTEAAENRGVEPKLHFTVETRSYINDSWFGSPVAIRRAEGDVIEPKAELLSANDLGVEWEWEGSPEVTLTVVDTVEEAVELFNGQSPRFVASLISSDSEEQDRFWATIDAPFVGDGFTRWVDGQYALNRPELGLSNWQSGRLFGRGGVLSGNSVYTIRSRAHQNLDTLAR